jgi:hypothetical protein
MMNIYEGPFCAGTQSIAKLKKTELNEISYCRLGGKISHSPSILHCLKLHKALEGQPAEEHHLVGFGKLGANLQTLRKGIYRYRYVFPTITSG